jgi:plasmid stabilization system protein ParE
MKRKLIYRPIAKKEFADAALWYHKQSKRAGKQFFSRVETVISEILKQPNRYPIVFDDFRAAPVPDFPYCVYYFETSKYVVITAVYPCSRDPDNLTTRR